VNWFRTENGKFLWPGFGENSRVLKWICERIGSNPTGQSVITPIGHLPAEEALDIGGLDITRVTFPAFHAFTILGNCTKASPH
jgi:phosphoenolpyruvate carboxykinase (GTP)